MKPNLLDINFKEGAMLLVNKPLTWTSFQAINKIKYTLKKVKIGHSGTLDPLATGLLIICTGKWTKKLTNLIGLAKEYTGTITIGATTPTYDLESAPENFKDYSHITPQIIYNTALQFVGEQEQLPPMHSAVKVNGKRLYESARAGKTVELKPRAVTISSFEIVSINLPDIHFKVACSSGTYLRSLAHDFGNALHVGAHLSALCRTKIGEYNLEDAYTLDEIINTFKTVGPSINKL
jgi:tRNA pseudouridine55 synthase